MKFTLRWGRKPKPVVVFAAGAAHELMPGESIQAKTGDGQRYVLERSADSDPRAAAVLRLVAYAKPNGLKAVRAR